MSLLVFIHSNYLFKTLLQCFYIALSHISIRTRNKSSAREINHPHALYFVLTWNKLCGPTKTLSKKGTIRPVVNFTLAKDPPPVVNTPIPYTT